MDVAIVGDLKKMLDEHSVLVKSFRMVREAFKENESINVNLKLMGKCVKDERIYNLPASNELAILIVGDVKNLERGIS